MPFAWSLRVLPLALCAVSACFDSDDKFRNEGTTGTTTAPTTSFTDTGGTGILTTAGETGVEDCNDAIECIQNCALAIAAGMEPEPDLGCFLECTDPLMVEEVVTLIDLGSCVSVYCEEIMCCIPPAETTSDSGGSSGAGSSGGSSSSTGGSSGGTGGTSTGDTGTSTGGESSGTTGGGLNCGPFADVLMDTCIACIFDQMVKDPEDAPPACVDIALQCRMQ